MNIEVVGNGTGAGDNNKLGGKLELSQSDPLKYNPVKEGSSSTEDTIIPTKDSAAVRCSDLSMSALDSTSSDLHNTNPEITIAEYRQLKDELAIVKADRDRLETELMLLKMDMDRIKDEPVLNDASDDQDQEEDGVNAAPNYRTNFRLPSFVSNTPVNIEEVNFSNDEASLDSDKEDTLSPMKEEPLKSQKLANKRPSLMARVFGRNKRKSVKKEEPDTGMKGDIDMEGEEEIAEKPATKRASVFKMFTWPGADKDDFSSDSSSSSSSEDESESADVISPLAVAAQRSQAQSRRSSTRLEQLTDARRNLRESRRISKSFKIAEESVDSLKSCLKGMKGEGPKKGKIMFRESMNTTREVAKVRGSAWDDCFWTEEQMAEFKYEAFMEECGLNDEDFD